jgi:hypothetical protein
MKPLANGQVQHKGNLGAGRQNMTIDVESLPHIMSVLTDLYSDPAGAMLREIAVNAHDSHKAAGNTDPIEITLPNELDRTLTIRDRGVGMNIDEITNNFSRYGSSTKRDTDDETGYFGLGSKSPLTYTSQFTFISVKGGIKYTVLITRGENGLAGFEIVDTCKTDEPNGVTVQVPVKDIDEIRRKAAFLFGFWEEGSVLVDGEPPTPPEGEHLDADVMITKGHILAQDYVVMGNVPYPVEYNHGLWRGGDRYTRNNTFRVVARVPMGSVGFTPSREALHYTPETLDTLDTIREFVYERRLIAARRDIETAASAYEAVTRTNRWRQYFPHEKFIWGSHQVPRMITTWPDIGWAYDPRTDEARSFVSRDIGHNFWDVSRLYAASGGVSLRIEEYPNKAFARHHKERIRQYADKLSMSPHSPVIVYNEPFGSPWLDGLPKVTWADVVAATEAPKKQAPAQPVERFVTKVNDDDYRSRSRIPEADLKKMDKIVFISQSMKSRSNFHEAFPGYTILQGHPRQVSRLTREYGVLDLPEAMEQELAWFKKLGSVEKAVIIHGSDLAELSPLDCGKIRDPEFRKVYKGVRKAIDGDLARRWRALTHFTSYYYTPSVYVGKLPRMQLLDDVTTEETHPIVEMIERYPLLDGVHHRTKPEHVLEYINSVYTTRQEKKA